MNKKKFVFVDFKSDILKISILENKEEDIIFILPSHSSKKEIKKNYQNLYGIRKAEFLTMEELKELMFTTEKPVIKEDKRMLIFYGILTEEEKNFFHISDYFSAVKFIRDFFAYYTDLYEGCITEKDVFALINNSITGNSSQLGTLKRISELKIRYGNVLDELGFIDPIFLFDRKNISFKPFYKKAVVVNQFYYTELEKAILDTFPSVVFYLQMPENLYDKDQMKLSEEFDAKYLKGKITNKISYFQAKDKLAMYAKMLSDLKDKKIFILDLDYNNFKYKNLLDKTTFWKNAESFKKTQVFEFLVVIKDIIGNMKNNLFPLKYIAKALLTEPFINYFNFDKADINAILLEIYLLNENEIKFLDDELVKNYELSQNFKEKFTMIFDFLKKFLNINSLKDFVFLFHNDIEIQNIGFETENASEVFFQSLYDVLTLADILEKFKDNIIYNTPINFYLQLFIEHLKYKTFALQNNEAKYFFISLLDTRNLQFSNIAIVNLVNGVLPSAPKSSIFISESQRKKLHLLTYNDLRLREKYYFYRLLASAKNIRLYSYFDLENNVEPSSFTEDFLYYFSDEIEKNEISDFNYSDFYKEIIGSNSKVLSNGYKVFKEDDFFKFKADIQKELYLSHSKFLQLKNAPFIYYITHKLNIPFYKTEFSEEYSSVFIGDFVHKVFSALFKRIKYLYKNPDEKLIYNKEIYGKAAIESVYKNIDMFKYKKNYNEADIYFDTFFKMFLQDSIHNFIYILFKKLQGQKNIKYIPETDKKEHDNYRYFDTIDNIKISIVGYSDLRIETYKKNYIFDYKTSSVSSFNMIKEQLKFYEFYYYYNTLKKVESAFYFVFDEKLKSIFSKKSSKDLKKIISDLVEKLKSGYMASEKDNNYTDFDITRADKKIKRS